MWPNPRSKSRLCSQRSSMMPTLKNPLSLNKVKSSGNLNNTTVLEKFETNNISEQTPLIFVDKKQDYSSIGSRKFSLVNNDIKKCENFSRRMNNELSSIFTKRSNSTAIPKSNSVKNLILRNNIDKSISLLETKKSPKFENSMKILKNLSTNQPRRMSYATVSVTDERAIKSRNTIRGQMTENEPLTDLKIPSENKNLINYILKEIDKLDEIKENL